MNILITGATGFVGSHLVDHLNSKGHNLYLLVRNPKKAQVFQLKGHLISGDLSDQSISKWTETLPESLDLVIHTAGIVHSFSKKDFEEINTKASLKLFESLNYKYPNIRIIFISSLAAYGPTPDHLEVLKEASPQNPVSFYGQSKKQVEEVLKEHYSDRALIINPPMIIGPRDVAVLDIFKMVKSKFVFIAGLDGLDKEYSFINIFDLVSFIDEALEQNVSGQFFVSHAQVITTQQLIETIADQMQLKSFVVKIPSPILKFAATSLAFINKFFPLSVRLTPDKIHELLPRRWVCNSEKCSYIYPCKWDLKKTVEVTLKDYQERKWL